MIFANLLHVRNIVSFYCFIRFGAFGRELCGQVPDDGGRCHLVVPNVLKRVALVRKKGTLGLTWINHQLVCWIVMHHHVPHPHHTQLGHTMDGCVNYFKPTPFFKQIFFFYTKQNKGKLLQNKHNKNIRNNIVNKIG